MNYKIININDAEYPQTLKQIYNPPQELYCIGDISLLNSFCIGIVGCRRASKYGLKIAEIFSNGLSKNGICIVSGMALGIDAKAQETALLNIGKTIAVLGSGIDVVYPKENIELYKSIVKKGGLIISEFKPGTLPSKYTFPKRNRIISGLSSGLLVVEAKKKSGTIITVDYAIEQGKNVYVIPGNIDSLNSVGTNELIKQGAKMVTNYLEIIEDCKSEINQYLS